MTADYSQFYALRTGAEWASDQVPGIGYEEHLWTNGAFVVICTHRQFGPTRVVVDVLDGPPTEPDARWQHVAEASLESGGDLDLHSWDPGAPELTIAIDPGPVRLRINWTGLERDPDEGFDDDADPQELFFQVWPAPSSGSRVLRWWKGWRLPERSTTSPEGRRQFEDYDVFAPKLATLEQVATLTHLNPPAPMPGGGGAAYSVWFDPTDGSWWIDGYDVRRTLREVSEADGRRLSDLATG